MMCERTRTCCHVSNGTLDMCQPVLCQRCIVSFIQ